MATYVCTRTGIRCAATHVLKKSSPRSHRSSYGWRTAGQISLALAGAAATLIYAMSNEPNLFSDRIHIEQLEISARVGVPEKERAAPQRLTASITLWPQRQAEELHDHIAKTVNYSEVCEETKKFVRDHTVKLIETLAGELATHLLQRFAIARIAVELRKFVVPDAKYVSVTVTRSAALD
jgi:dihydroneopterin aldolase